MHNDHQTIESEHAQRAEAKLRWACRRGMLELDIVLMRFLQHTYPTLLPSQQQLFQQLLTYPDQILMQWLLRLSEPPAVVLAELIQLIRHASTAISP